MTVIEEPFHETLYDFMALQDVNRIERYARDTEAMKNAEYMGYAFHAPKELNEVWAEREKMYQMEQNPLLTEEERNRLAVERAKKLAEEYDKKEFTEMPIEREPI